MGTRKRRRSFREDIQYVEVYDRNGNSERIDASSTEVDGLKVYSLDSSVNVAGNGEDLPAMYNHWYTKTVPSAYIDYANNQLYYELWLCHLYA